MMTAIKMAIHRSDESPIHGEGTTHVEIQDEGGGPFVVLRQMDWADDIEMRLEIEELREALRAAEIMLTHFPEDK